MRILVLSSLYPPHAIGGYEHACKDVVDRWRANGHEVTVLTSSARLVDIDDAEDPGVHRALTLLAGGPPGTRHPHGRLGRTQAVIRDRATLRRVLRESHPDVVSVWHAGGLTTAVLEDISRADLPVVWVACDAWPSYWVAHDPIRIGRSSWLWRQTDLGLVGTWVTCSQALADELAADAPWSIQASAVVGLGVDRKAFPQVTPEPTPWQWRILYVGRLVPEKGPATAVRALAELPEQATLSLVGHGDQAFVDELRSIAHGLGCDHRLTISQAHRADLRGRYLDADVVVFPSEWNEPFGLVPLEAMACGRPVVATGVGGSGEYLSDGSNCLLFPPGDAGTLAARILRLADDEQLRARLVEQGARTAEAHTTDRLAVRLEQIHLAAVSPQRLAVAQGRGDTNSSSGAE